MDSDDGDTPEINHHHFMGQVARLREEKRRRHRERQKRAISNIKLTGEDGKVQDPDDATNFAAVCARLFGAVFFLGIGIGALVYSVYKSDYDKQFQVTTPTPPKVVHPFQNFTATKGSFILERCVKYDANRDCTESEDQKLSAQWYQDDYNKQLVLQIGGVKEELFVRYIAFKNKLYTYNETNGKNHCEMDLKSNYTDFINSFGKGSTMKYEHTVTMSDYNSTTAWVFSGRAANSSAFRYTSPDSQGVMYGWQGYPYNDELNTKRYEYWFGTAMTKAAPDPVTFTPPQECKDLNGPQALSDPRETPRRRPRLPHATAGQDGDVAPQRLPALPFASQRQGKDSGPRAAAEAAPRQRKKDGGPVVAEGKRADPFERLLGSAAELRRLSPEAQTRLADSLIAGALSDEPKSTLRDVRS